MTQLAPGSLPVFLLSWLAMTANIFAAEESSPWKQDLAEFKSGFLEADASYSPDERARAEQLFARLEDKFTSLSDAEIELRLAEIAAVTDNGHSFLMPGGWTARYPRLPVDFRVFADGVFIIKGYGDSRGLRGRKLLAINGHAVDSLAQTWARYQGGLKGWRDHYLPFFLETPALLLAAGVIETADSVTLSLLDESGVVTALDLKPQDDLPPLEGFNQYIPPPRVLVEAAEMSEAELPLYLQQPALAFRMQTVDDIDAVYIQFKANVDFSGNQDIGAFVNSAAELLSARRPSTIVLDQRFNFGGDLTTTRELMKKLPGYLAPDGRIFAITSGRTFSAGISSLGYAKQAAGDRLVIVGEAAGDALEFWAEGDLLELPNSGVAFLMATERHNYKTGCPESDCHRNIRVDPIQIESLDPDVPAPLNWADYRRGIDPAMREIRAMIEGAPAE